MNHHHPSFTVAERFRFLRGGDSSTSNSSTTTVLYLCVAEGGRILHSYSRGEDRRPELESLATLCLESAPPYHSWYTHTAGELTAALLMEDGYIYLALVDPTPGGGQTLDLLRGVRDDFKSSLRDDLVPVVRSLIASLETISAAAGEDRTVRIDVDTDRTARTRGGQKELMHAERRVWWRGRRLKIVLAADAILCLVLFGAWLAVCRGFRCVS